MHLFVVRHAIADDVGPGVDDAERPLTPGGVSKLRRALRGLRALELPIARILTSPWRRAAETAAELGRITRTPPVVTALLTRPPSAELLAQIAESSAITAVVGHEPWLGELAAWLAFGDPRHGDALVIKKAGVLWLEGTAVPGGMQLRALLPPRLLRAIAFD